ncbi:30S ribosomal protein S13 [Candidatus Woesearchaeota archaeon]|nr:30S ribosomal protein S13 [Candidatus Woesearchaeota archaeon]
MAEQKQLIRILNTDIDGNKRLLFALRAIKGVSYMIANYVCYKAGIDKMKKAGELTDDEIEKIEHTLLTIHEHAPSWLLNRRKDWETGQDLHLYKTDLDFKLDEDLRRLKRIKSYRGLRHQWGLPVRGQRTKSNFRKNKGKPLGVKRKK